MIRVACPLPGCEAQIELEVKQDGDDHRNWYYADPTSTHCEDGHILTADRWDKLLESDEVIDKINDYVLNYDGGL